MNDEYRHKPKMAPPLPAIKEVRRYQLMYFDYEGMACMDPVNPFDALEDKHAIDVVLATDHDAAIASLAAENARLRHDTSHALGCVWWGNKYRGIPAFDCNCGIDSRKGQEVHAALEFAALTPAKKET